jgi:hypothetical protein
MKKQRFVFVQDQSCHWYMIPVKLKARFEKLSEAEDEALDEEFEKYLTGGGIGHITFCDPASQREVEE